MSDITNRFVKKQMTDKDFTRLSTFIHSEYGIKLPPVKKVMLESRLNKRLKALQLDSFHDYVEYVLSRDGQEYELIHMIDLVTTNKTDFFREPVHFDYLVQIALPDLIRRFDVGIQRELKVWSAACSTGEEPYTLAMVLNEFAETKKKFHYSILSTDISTRVLEHAKKAIYDAEKLTPVSHSLKKKYCLKSKNKEENLIRIKPFLRSHVRFFRLNLMDDHYDNLEPMDITFCRNVIIYFDKPTQEKMINNMCKYIKPGSYLFMGHSETLFNMKVPLKQEAPTIYRRV